MTDDGHDRDDGPISAAWLAVALGIFAVAGAVGVAWRPMNGDASWYVYIAGRFLDGDRPYVDLIDTNPPLILWVNMGVVALARTIGMAPLVAYHTFVFGLIGASLALAWRTSRGLPESLRRASLAGFGYMLLVGVGPAFGQREHLALALVLPYAYAASAEARGERSMRGPAIVVGLLAGVGFSMKPFFVFAGLAVELFLAARRGLRVWLRPEALAMAAVVFVDGVFLLILTPEYLDVARRFAPLYPAHNPLGSTLVASSWRLWIVAAAIGLAWAACRRRAPGWAEVVLLLDVWMTAAVYLTGKGWGYHWFPALAISWSIGIGAAAMLLVRVAGRRTWMLGAAMVGPCPDPDGARPPGDRRAAPRRRDGPDRPRRVAPGRRRARPLPLAPQGVPDGERVGRDLGDAAPDALADRGGLPGGDLGLRPLSQARRDASRGAASSSARSRPSFLAHRPKLLLVDDDPPTPLLTGFRYLDYFSLDPAVARALRGYEFVERTPSFVVYRRRDGKSDAIASALP